MWCKKIFNLAMNDIVLKRWSCPAHHQPLKMAISLIFFSVLLIIVLAAIGRCISFIVSKVRLGNAVKRLPTPQKQHWLLGHLPYFVSNSCLHYCTDLPPAHNKIVRQLLDS